MDKLEQYVRSVPDFPKKGINFYDITTLIQHEVGYNKTIDKMTEFAKSKNAEKIVAIESRGFVFGGAMADRLNLGLITIRKPGKLPSEKISEEYSLEYGTDTLEMHVDAVKSGEKVVIVDDLIATGGTIKAACNLVERVGGEVVGVSAVIELSFLPWRKILKNYDINYLISYDSE
ncbi:MAG: adenine phosphoribosyltransferase [Candidatus Zixiibacteriota bacterium]|nr:MAG: adenine phosphoribosyltransferase [candidate division Zixibacteria bacterium]